MDNALISYPHNFFLQYKTAKLWIKSGTKGAQVYVYTNPLKKKNGLRCNRYVCV